MMPDWEISVEERKGWIRWVEKEYLRASKNSVRIMLAVTLEFNQKLIGMVGIGNKSEVNNEIEIAYKCGFTKLATKMVKNSGETEVKPFYYYRLFNTGAVM